MAFELRTLTVTPSGAPAIDLVVFVAVLLSAVFQAAWNFTTKRSRADKIALLAVGWFSLGIVLLPFCFWLHEPGTFEWVWIRFMLASGFVQAFYLCLLGWAYEVGEISVVFPVARGMGILGSAAGALFFDLHVISGFGALGVAGVVTGVLLIGSGEVPHRARRKAFLLALAVAVTVSTYSLVDSMGARHVPLLPYLAAMHLLAPLFASPFLLGRMRSRIVEVALFHKREAFTVATAGLLSYAIVLWAYQRAPMAYVATLREFSVVIASLLGFVVLRENLSPRKIAGIVVILLGIGCLKAS